MGSVSHAILLAFEKKTLGMEKPCVFLFIKAKQLAIKFPLPRLPVSGESRLNREGKEQLLLKQRHSFKRGTLHMAVQPTYWNR